MKTLLILCILFISLNCYADKYKKIESQVRKYERIATSFNEIKNKGEELYSKVILNGSEYVNCKKYYNRKYDILVEVAYLLEEVIIIEGGLTTDDLIVPMNERIGGIDDIGKRRYNKSVDELIVDIDKNIKLLSSYIREANSYYGQKQAR